MDYTHELYQEHVKLVQTIYGNGKVGLCDIVGEHEKYIQNQAGALSVIKWGLGFIGIGELALLFKTFIH